MVGMVIDAGMTLLLVRSYTDVLMCHVLLLLGWKYHPHRPFFRYTRTHLHSIAVRRLQKRELLVLSKEELEEVLDHGRFLAVRDDQGVEETKTSPPGTPPALSRGTLAAISSNLQTKMIAVGLLRA